MNKLISTKIAQPAMAQIVSSFIVFIICIIGLSMLTSAISGKINSKFPQSINITMGFAFGFLKGFLLCSLVFTTILTVFGETDDLSIKSGPAWLQKSQTYKPLSFGSYMILPFVDSAIGKFNKNTEIDNNQNTEDTKINKNNIDIFKEKINDSTIKIEEIIDEGGYRKDQVDKMNHLLESINKD